MDEIKSLDDFAKTIESINAGKDYNFIYRGCGKSNYTLSPSLFRHRVFKKIEDFLDLESKILDSLKLEVFLICKTHCLIPQIGVSFFLCNILEYQQDC